MIATRIQVAFGPALWHNDELVATPYRPQSHLWFQENHVKTIRTWGKFSTLAVAVAASVLGVFAAKAHAARCICPLYYAPLTCSNGRSYSNICFARCAGATNCVPSDRGV